MIPQMLLMNSQFMYYVY